MTTADRLPEKSGHRPSRLAVVRKRLGYSQEGFAEKVGVDLTTVGRWERGNQEPQPWMRPKIAKALGITLEELADLIGSEPAEVRSEQESDQTPLRGLANHDDGTESPSLIGEWSTQDSDLLDRIDQTRYMMDRAIAGRTVTPAQVDKIDQMVRLHGQACVAMPPLVMLRRLVADFNELRVLISQAQSPTTLVRLYACIAQISALVADELMVLGETHRAWAWHHTATVAADETELPALGLQVRSLGILIPLYSGDSREALSMAVDTCGLGGSTVSRSSPAYALAVTLKALILAQLGLMDECRVALGESGEVFTHLDQAGKADSIFGFSERRWRFYRSRTFTQLGQLDEAWEAQDRALELYPTDVIGDPTIIQLDRALCLVRKNEIDAGCDLAVDTLSNLPSEHQASIFFEYGKKILTAVPQKHAARKSVRQYRAILAESR